MSAWNMPTTSQNTWNKIQIPHCGLQALHIHPWLCLRLQWSPALFPIAHSVQLCWAPMCSPDSSKHACVEGAGGSLTERLFSQDLSRSLLSNSVPAVCPFTSCFSSWHLSLPETVVDLYIHMVLFCLPRLQEGSHGQQHCRPCLLLYP